MATIESDDWAALTSMRFPEVQANASFESGMTKWTVAGGTWSTPTTGGAVGPRYAKITGSGAYLFQRVRITDPDSLSPALNIKKGSAAATGSIQVVIRARELTYDTTGPCTFDLPNDWDFQGPTLGPWTTISTSNLTPTTTWTHITTIPDWDEVDTWDGADVEIRVFNQLTTGTADIDYVRTEKPGGV